MFCVTARNHTTPENLDKVIQSFQEESMPLLSRQPGFKCAYLMTKASGEFMLLHIWATEQDADTWRQAPEHKQLETQLTQLVSDAPSIDIYDVPVHAVA